MELTARRAQFWRRHRLLTWVGGVLLLALGVLTAVVLIVARRVEPLLRAQIVKGLENHFHARVELDSFHVTLRNGLWVEGTGLRIWPPGTETAGSETPLIRLAEFRFHAPLEFKPGQAIRISVVQLKGLEVDVPPRSHFAHDAGAAKGATRDDAWPAKAAMGMLGLNVESVECSGAHLTVETSKPGKLPLEFAIAHLKMTGIDDNGAMDFEAELTNPMPVGTIHTQGKFGPWVVSDPGETPLMGDYRFEHADLSGFSGIAGILSSTGHYAGTLREITVDGETDTPDFRLTHFGTALELHTKFHARVDGTNGDTWLEPVEATLGSSHLWARGQIVRVAAGANGVGAGGHDIALMVNVDRGRVEDFLRLTSGSGTPMLTGALTMKADLEILPGPAPVHERLTLKGTFALDDAQFTSAKIQDRVAELSARGLGQPKDAKNGGPADVRSTMSGNFALADGVVRLPALKYTVPGAVIDLKGSYGMDGGTLNFAGSAKTEATVSAMVGGWKGMLLKPLDRYFKKDGAGTEVPIHIGGTKENPEFGIDFGRMKGSSAEPQDGLPQ